MLSIYLFQKKKNRIHAILRLGKKGVGGGGGGVRFHLGALPERAFKNINEVFCFLYFYIVKKNNEILLFVFL